MKEEKKVKEVKKEILPEKIQQEIFDTIKNSNLIVDKINESEDTYEIPEKIKLLRNRIIRNIEIIGEV